MTVRVSKPEFSLREKISELDKPYGLKGNELLRSETSQEARGLIGAGRKNLIINGAMQIAQRGTSTTTLGYLIDRFLSGAANINNPTYAQVDVASGTEPYAAGFRKAAKYTGGNNAVHSNDVLKFNQKIEARNIATSGWNFKSGASFITLSFWVKSSVGQTFFGRLQSQDGTNQNYPYSYDVPANIWTKVVKTIPGNSNITFDNDDGFGMDVEWTLYRGVDTTASSTVLNQWQAYSAGTRLPDGVPSAWHDTNAATWEITGIQLEVGRNATEFEHLSRQEELALCYRYYRRFSPYSPTGTDNYCGFGVGLVNQSGGGLWTFPLDIPMRDRPSITQNNLRIYDGSGNENITAMNTNRSSQTSIWVEPATGTSSFTVGRAFIIGGNNTAGGYVELDAEL